jgi:ribosomal protein S18 acetylase RimI-like enzyme
MRPHVTGARPQNDRRADQHVQCATLNVRSGDALYTRAMSIIVRDARPSDFAALASMDLRYDTSRVLSLRRSGVGAAIVLAFVWRERAPGTALYNEYPESRLRDAASRVDLFAVAEIDGVATGLLMIIKPSWTDAAEITDLAVDRRSRRTGAGRALVEHACGVARQRGWRALWVEPRSDNAAAIAFYLREGFRISGYNDRMYANTDDADGRVTLFMYRELT